MKKIILTLAMMLVVSTISVAQINLNLNINNVDTLNSAKSNVSVVVDIAPNPGWKILNCDYSCHTVSATYNGFMELRDTVSQNLYSSVQGSVATTTPYLNGFAGVLNNPNHMRFTNGLYLPCLLQIGTVIDTLVINLQIAVEDIPWTQSMVVDTTLYIPLVLQFNQLPSLSYDNISGILSMTSGDWKTASTSSNLGALLFFRQGLNNILPPLHFVNDTSIGNLWTQLDAIGYTDSCITLSLYTGEEWCLSDEQVVCRSNSALYIADKNKINLSIYPNPTNGIVMIDNLPSESFIILTDMLGKIITQTGTGQKMIDLTTQSNGVYFLKVSSPYGEYNTKIIKK